MKVTPALLVAAVLSTGIASNGSAQLRDTGGGVGIRLESYYFDDADEVGIDQIQLLTLPVSLQAPITRNVRLGINGAFARAAMRRPGQEEVTMSGLTDTQVSLTMALADERIQLGIVGLVPTGVSELTAKEMDVAGVIAADLLPFAVTSWGTGGGLGMNGSMAVPLDEQTAVGFSGGYVVAREYEPLAAGAFAYRPGDQLHLRAAVDRTIGSAGKASLQLGYFRFGDDQQDGANVYHSGDRLQVVGSYAFAAGYSGSGVLYTGYIHRDRGRYTDAVQVVPAQHLAYFGAGFRQLLGRRTVILPSLDVRLLNSSPEDQSGFTISGGVGLEVPLGGLDFVPTVRGRFGNLAAGAGGESRYRGVDLGVTLRRRGSR